MAARSVLAHQRMAATNASAEHIRKIAEKLEIEVPEYAPPRMPDVNHAAAFRERYMENALKLIREKVVGPIGDEAEVTEDEIPDDSQDETVDDDDTTTEQESSEPEAEVDPNEPNFQGKRLSYYMGLTQDQFKAEPLNRGMRKKVELAMEAKRAE